MNKLLILGGTNFIGRNLVDSLVKLNKFELTLFNRGQSNPDLFPEVRKLHGDRNTSDIDLIFEERWDYIIDLSCYFPAALSQIVSRLENISRYVFVSTCSVYDNNRDKSILRNERAPTLSCSPDESVDTSVAAYGKRKAECERILTQSNLNYTIFRPALVYGPYDPTDRLYYWLYQVATQDQMLITGHGEKLFSVTYVQDLIQAIVKSINPDLESGIYNASTFPALSISKLIETATNLLNKHPKSYSAKPEFLKSNQIAQWVDLPLWLDCDYYTYDNSKVLGDFNLEITDFRDSIASTIDYYRGLNWKTPNFGISDTIKNELIQKLENTQG